MTGLIGRGSLAGRLREVRLEHYGPDGLGLLADQLEIHARTWENYERGVTITGMELLKFMVRTRVNPHWLLTGRGERYAALVVQVGSD